MIQVNIEHIKHLKGSIIRKTMIFGMALLAQGFLVIAQSNDSIPNPAIQLIARAQEGKILLRWAMDEAAAWQRGNSYGYTLERFTVYRNGKRLENPERMLLSEAILKPAPLDQWETMALSDDNAAIIAQAIYGDAFEIGTEEGELMQIVNKAQALEQRFSFALFAADMNFEAAKLAGLGFEDAAVKPNEGYLYRLRSEIPKALAVVSEGIVYIEASATEPLPAPIDLVGVFNDRSVLLTWEYEMFRSTYTSYYVERSEDGTNFKRLDDLPLLNLNNKPDAPAKRMYYIDTIPQNDKQYHYQVLGVSPFGEKGLASESISGMGKKGLSSTAFITRHDLIGETSAKITWEFPEEAENEVAEFQLRSAKKQGGLYETIKRDIPIKSRTAEVDGLSGANYLKVVAVGKDSTETESFATLVQLIDSIPPSIPKGLVGVIDSMGIVTISWENNTEKDLLGYRVFRGNLEKEEYSQLTVSPIVATSFQDTVQIKSLNDKVFYSIVAVDQRFNNSGYSDMLELVKPDVVPPSAPIFKDFKVSDDGVFLSWVKSAGNDVSTHQIYRKVILGDEGTQGKDEGWDLLWETKDTLSTYIDEKVLPGTKYSYSVQAMDKSGLISEPSPNLTVETASSFDEKLIKGLNVEVDRVQNTIKLYWRKPTDTVREFVIYKSRKDGKPVLWKQLPATITQVLDRNISPTNIYTYQLRPVLADGGYGKMETLEVNY